MPWVEWERLWLRSHVTAAQVRQLYRRQGAKVRVSLTGKRATFYRSRRTGRLTRYATYRRWGPERIARERWREWLVELYEKEPGKEPEEWEATVRYRSGQQFVDLTARILVPAEYVPASNEEVRAAFWRAVHGHPLTRYKLLAVDWRREVTRRGKTVVYEGSSEDQQDLRSFTGMVRTLGYARVRVARVEA